MYHTKQDKKTINELKGSNEMNENKNKKRSILAAAVVAGVLLVGGVGFGIANQGNDDKGAVSSPTASASPSSTATDDDKPKEDVVIESAPSDGTIADPEGVVAELLANPLGQDFATIMEKSVADSVYKVFPEAEFKVSDGVLKAMQSYEVATSRPELYTARDGISADMAIVDRDIMTSDLADRIEKEINETGQTTALWTVPASGIVKDSNGVEYKVADSAMTPASQYGRPGIIMSDEGTDIVIKGDGLSGVDRNERARQIKELGKSDILGSGRIFTLPLENGQFYHVSIAWFIEITPVGDGNWQISEMGYDAEDFTAVVTDSAVWEGRNA